MTTTAATDLLDELRTLREAGGILERSWIAALELRGADRVRFLNGYVTCDVAAAEPGGGIYGFVTQVKGKILADVRILALEDRLWLELPAGRAEEVCEHLGKYAVFDQVELELLDRRAFSLIGPGAAEILGAAPETPHGHRPLELFGLAAHGVRDPGFGDAPAWTIWVPEASATAVRERLLEHDGVSPVSFEAWDTLRVEAGRPLFGQDYGGDNFPQETGLEDAVSYTKGCYLGQEVVARIHYRGGVNRWLRGLRFDGEADGVLGQALVHDGREAGIVTSLARSPDLGTIGLAIVHKRLESGSTVATEGGATVRVVDLPF